MTPRDIGISVVIPTFDRAAHLEYCLASLARQSLPRTEFEVIVIDDGSSDATPEVCRTWQQALALRYVGQRHCGPSPARNLGLFMARAPIVLFFDDDESAHGELLAQHLGAHQRFPSLGSAILGHTALSPRVPVTPLMHYVVAVGQFLLSYPSVPRDQPLGFAHFWTGRLSVKRDFLTQFGIFSQRLNRLEDIELGYRLARHGLEVRYWPDALSFRETGIDFAEFCRRMQVDGRAVRRLLELHPDPEMRAYCALEDAGRQWLQAQAALPTWMAAAESLEAELGSRGQFADHPRAPELWELYRRCFLAHRFLGASQGFVASPANSVRVRWAMRRLAMRLRLRLL
jgi:GT2 family glycosyltransferase